MRINIVKAILERQRNRLYKTKINSLFNQRFNPKTTKEFFNTITTTVKQLKNGHKITLTFLTELSRFMQEKHINLDNISDKQEELNPLYERYKSTEIYNDLEAIQELYEKTGLVTELDTFLASLLWIKNQFYE